MKFIWNTKHAARKIQIDRQVEKKTHTYQTDSWKHGNRQGMCVRETEVIIGKSPRLGIHTPYHQLGVSHVSLLWEEMRRWIKQFKLFCIRKTTPICRVYVYWAKDIYLEFGERLELLGTSCTIVGAVLHSGFVPSLPVVLDTGTLPCFVLESFRLFLLVRG